MTRKEMNRKKRRSGCRTDLSNLQEKIQNTKKTAEINNTKHPPTTVFAFIQEIHFLATPISSCNIYQKHKG